MVNFKQNNLKASLLFASDATETNKIAKVVSKMLCCKIKEIPVSFHVDVRGFFSFICNGLIRVV